MRKKHHERGGNAEGDGVGDGIEFLAEEGFAAAEAGDAAIKGVAEGGEEDAPDGFGVEFVGVEFGGGDVAGLNAADDGDEAEEEVAGGEEVGKEIDAGGFLRIFVFGRGRIRGRVAVVIGRRKGEDVHGTGN